MLPNLETDLSLADFDGPRRHYTAPTLSESVPNQNTPGLSDRGHKNNGARERSRQRGAAKTHCVMKDPPSRPITGDPEFGKPTQAQEVTRGCAPWLAGTA